MAKTTAYLGGVEHYDISRISMDGGEWFPREPSGSIARLTKNGTYERGSGYERVEVAVVGGNGYTDADGDYKGAGLSGVGSSMMGIMEDGLMHYFIITGSEGRLVDIIIPSKLSVKD